MLDNASKKLAMPSVKLANPSRMNRVTGARTEFHNQRNAAPNASMPGLIALSHSHVQPVLMASHAAVTPLRNQSTLFHNHRIAPTNAAMAMMIRPMGFAFRATFHAHWAAVATPVATALPI